MSEYANTIDSPLTFAHFAAVRAKMMGRVNGTGEVIHFEQTRIIVSPVEARTIRSLLDADVIEDHLRRILAGRVTPTRRIHRARITAALNARMRQRFSTETRERANDSAFAWFRAMGAPCERQV